MHPFLTSIIVGGRVTPRESHERNRGEKRGRKKMRAMIAGTRRAGRSDRLVDEDTSAGVDVNEDREKHWLGQWLNDLNFLGLHI